MKSLHCSLLLVLSSLLLACGLSLAADSKVGRAPLSTVDCAGNCADNRNKMLERCDRMPGNGAEKCREMANRQYDKCVERCNGGGGMSAQPGL
jgi:hypothetical protein